VMAKKPIIFAARFRRRGDYGRSAATLRAVFSPLPFWPVVAAWLHSSFGSHSVQQHSWTNRRGIDLVMACITRIDWA